MSEPWYVVKPAEIVVQGNRIMGKVVQLAFPIIYNHLSRRYRQRTIQFVKKAAMIILTLIVIHVESFIGIPSCTPCFV